jgi:hypothetical protein
VSFDEPASDPASRAARLRAMNEKIRRRRDEFEGSAARAHELMCECIDPDCSSMLRVLDDELDRARAEDDLFIVDPDHTYDASVVHLAASHSVIRLPAT